MVEFLVVAGLLLANAFFVAAEFALVKVRVSQIDELAGQGDWAAKVTGRLLNHLDAYLSASQFGITLASLGLGFVIERSVEPGIETLLHSIGLPEGALEIQGQRIPFIPAFAFVFVTFLHISIGELVPKSLAIRAARPMALITAPPLMAFYYLFFPVIWLLNGFSDLVLRLAGIGTLDHEALAHTEEELRHILSESNQGGHLSRFERVMIENVLNLEEKTAEDAMVPRIDIVYLSLARSVEENLRIARRAGHTRFPLCEDDLTTVVGFIHVKDLFRSSGSDDGRPDLRRLARTVPFLPETMQLDLLLLEFQRNQIHLAMLLNEHGDVVGMVTLETVLEKLVGQIQDEFDREPPRVESKDGGAFEVDGVYPVDELREANGVAVPEEIDSRTTGGLVVELLGRLATEGDTVVVGQHRLIVLHAEPNRVRRVRVEPIRAEPAEHPGPPAPPETAETENSPPP
ncbi:hemolysin family protein [Tautonia sp. JC769]|uniref:hemolysin family protein n=1 Tax=Tautonia sp. JC769 TaxID=3232135 RepID=UPI00345A40BE